MGKMCRNVRKRNFGHVHQENIQISLVNIVYYENTPIQTYRKFHLQKLKIFR